MATTLTLAYVLWPRAYVVHVGDSRCYSMREQELSQITKDQTVAQSFVDDGTVTAEDLERSPLNNVLSSAVGMNPTPVTSIVELRRGDTLLLCSDELTKHMGTPQIAEHLPASKSAEDACQRLLDAALQGGGSDNITMIVSRFGEAKIAAFRGNASPSRQEPLQLDRRGKPAEIHYG